MRLLSPSRLALALAGALCVLAASPGKAVEPAPATMVVSLVVPQSCAVNSGGSAALAPVVTCLHGEPWLVSQTQAPAAALAPPSRLRVAPDAIWTVVF